MMIIIINFMKMILKLLFMSKFWAGVINLKNANHLKKDISKELMHVAWHSTRWWDCCMSENEKKEIDPIATDKVCR